MKSKLTILTITVLLLLSGSVFANEGKEGMTVNKNEMMGQQGTMMYQGIPKADTKAVEVGNKICPVSGDKIPAPGEKGTMGDEPVKYEYNGKIYNLCCPMCIKDFKKNPEKYSKIAEDEVAKEKMMEQKEEQKGTTK